MEQVKKEQARLARNWFRELQEKLTSIPTEGIKGRTIVIDPGHTGFSPGATGPKQRIYEYEVNWQVARRLAELLTAAGARTVLTKQYGPPVPVELRRSDQDLDARAAVANRERADLFISIHHNWTDNPATNQIEVYYRLQDPGPSRDAGGYVLQHMVRNLGLEGKLLAANYRVLNRNTRPAILTEAAHLSNPIQESLLTLSSKQELEAQAIYLGILDYFSKGVPEFSLGSDIAQLANQRQPQVTVTIRGHPALDPKTIRAWLDGTPARVDYRQKENVCLVTALTPLANGRHSLRFEARNVNGNAGIPLDTSFLTDCEPAQIILTAFPPICPPGRMAMEIRATVLDADGYRVADTRKVSFTVGNQSYGDSVLRNGLARIWLSQSKPCSLLVVARCGKASSQLLARFGPVRQPLVRFRIVAGNPDSIIASGAMLDDWRPDTVFANPDGFVSATPAEGHHTFTFFAPGFRRTHLDLQLSSGAIVNQEVRLAPLFNSALRTARIALDPAGNWERPDTTHELVPFNRQLAGYLSRLLIRSGAEVLTVTVDTNPISRPDRLLRASEFKPHCYLKLSARSRRGHPSGLTVAHYPGSTVGASVAQAIASRFQGIAQLGSVTVQTERSFEVTHAPSAGVALYFQFSDSSVTRDTAFVRDVAQRILLGLAQQRGAQLAGRLILHLTAPQNKPVAGARITIDDLLVYQTDARGTVVIPDLDLGAHLIDITAPGYRRSTQRIELFSRTPVKEQTISLTPER